MKARFLPLVSFLLLAAASAPAIVIRHDRPDARYVDLAKAFGGYGDVVEAGSTLIHPRWLLTAAHVAESITPYTSFAVVGGRRYAIDRVILHPESGRERRMQRRDLALLRLTAPVKGVSPIPLYRGGDEVGQTVTFMGRGQTGNGETGPTGEDGKMRGATNKIESANEQSITFAFDPPETATDLEGISGPGDSGGPALLKVKGKWAIAGVSSANRGTPQAKGVCRYHTLEIYARVSTAVDWIERTMKNPPASTTAWTIVSPATDWPSTRSGEVGSALVAAFNSGDAAVMEAFNQKFRAPRALERATAEARAEGYRKLFSGVGAVTLVEYAQDPSGRLLALVKNAQGKHYQLSLYFFDPAFAEFDGYWLGEADPRRR